MPDNTFRQFLAKNELLIRQNDMTEKAAADCMVRLSNPCFVSAINIPLRLGGSYLHQAVIGRF